MNIHLDTSVLVAEMRGDDRIVEWIDRLSEQPSVSAIVLGELLYGARASARVGPNEARVNSLVAKFKLIEFDSACADTYANVRIALRKAGRPCGEADIAIAATALAYGGSLATLNRKHFEDIPGLTLIDWTTPT